MRLYGSSPPAEAGETRAHRGWARLAAAIGAAAALCTSALAQPADRSHRIQPEQVAPGVWLVQGESALGSTANRNFISNAAFVVTPEGVVVVDALGSPALARDLLDAIARITPLPVRQLIVTHYHADHVYGLQVFRERGITITAHR
jgi:glyoxylase-like metal-dependent hydrolase (beta-lactamase superfamily II)